MNAIHYIHTAISAALIGTAAMALSSCEQDLPIYDDPQGRLNFYYAGAADSVYNYSFNYHNGVERDTVWFELRTSGMLGNKERTFALQQIPSGNDDAVPGVHYVSFDDAEYQQNLKVKAGATSVMVPIIILKDSSLDEKDYTLKFAIKDSKDFVAGDMQHLFKKMNISNRLTQPTNWGTLMLFYFGHWGPVKHQFLIDHSDAKWDDEYLHELGVDNMATCDQAYLSYLATKMANILWQDVNYPRLISGEGYLKDADGTVIQFTNELYGY